MVLISVFGTLFTDNLTDHFGISLAFSTGLFSVMLAATFVIWRQIEGTLSIYAIDIPRREPMFSTAVCNRLNACALACCRILPSAKRQ